MECCRRLALALALLAGCSDGSPSVPIASRGTFLHLSGSTMGVGWNLTAIGLDGDVAALLSSLNAAVDQVDRHMSTYKADSEISRFGLAPPGEDFPVSDDTALVVRAAQRFATLTDGAFDVTVMPLVDLWGFGPAPAPDTAPSLEQIADALKRCGYAKLEISEDGTLRKSVAGLRIDLSAIAKGYGVDVLCAVLDDLGCRDYLVEIGGELRTKGVSADGSPWRIGIDDPKVLALPGVQLRAAIELGDRAVATSGDYRNFREVEGKRISHTIDPRSGYPVDHDLASVTILASTCLEADALATACMVLGPDQAMELVQSLADVECYLLVRDGEGFVGRASPGFPKLQTP